MRYLHYDVFTDRSSKATNWPCSLTRAACRPQQMQTITREMNFSESTFILPAEAPGTDVRMRIFTPGAELPMAGHPTIGSTFALAHGASFRPAASAGSSGSASGRRRSN